MKTYLLIIPTVVLFLSCQKEPKKNIAFSAQKENPITCTDSGPRGFHERSINSNSSWTKTNSFSLMNMPILTYIKEISPSPLLIIAGENAHSRYFSEDAFKAANEPKELLIIPGKVHTDLYDQVDVIPFEKLENFFKENLK